MISGCYTLKHDSMSGTCPPYLFIATSEQSAECKLHIHFIKVRLQGRKLITHWVWKPSLLLMASLVSRPCPAFRRFRFSFAHREKPGTRLTINAFCSKTSLFIYFLLLCLVTATIHLPILTVIEVAALSYSTSTYSGCVHFVSDLS